MGERRTWGAAVDAFVGQEIGGDGGRRFHTRITMCKSQSSPVVHACTNTNSEACILLNTASHFRVVVSTRHPGREQYISDPSPYTIAFVAEDRKG
jgi:hypothetical protein